MINYFILSLAKKNLILELKKIIILFSFLTTNIVVSQMNDKIVYEAEKIEIIVVKNGEEVARKPYGKNVTITYDKFWKSYVLNFFTEHNSGFFNLKYVTEMKAENKLGKVYKMTTGVNNDEIIYVIDGIDNEGVLLILVNDFPDAGTAYLEIKNVKMK